MNVVAINKGEVDKGQLRPPSQVMRLARLGAFQADRLSFVRVLLRRMHRDGWSMRRNYFDLDEKGRGIVVYGVEAPAADIALVCIGHEDGKTPAEINYSFVLYDGIPDEEELDRLRKNVELLDKGRFSARDFVLCRAERNEPLFVKTVQNLAAGKQPNLETLATSGHLLTTTAFFSNGKLGLADFERMVRIPGLSGPFVSEMLTLFLIREFSVDLVEHLARQRKPNQAARLTGDLRNAIGVGNSADLGLAPYLINHPVILDRWVVARETAIARVTGLNTAASDEVTRFKTVLNRACVAVETWQTLSPVQSDRIAGLREGLEQLKEQVDSFGPHWWGSPNPWARLVDWVERYCSLETQELVNSLILEPYPELVDTLAPMMRAGEEPKLDPAMKVARLLKIIERHYAWALAIDFTDPRTHHFVWDFVPDRHDAVLKIRNESDPSLREARLGMAREVVHLHTALIDDDGIDPQTVRVSAFLRRRPDMRAAVRRVQTIAKFPYGEIRDNILHADCDVSDIVRCKLAFFGATRFDPGDGKRMSALFFQGAPSASELTLDVDDWAFPEWSGQTGSA